VLSHQSQDAIPWKRQYLAIIFLAPRMVQGPNSENIYKKTQKHDNQVMGELTDT
jgi:hypothetical protein